MKLEDLDEPLYLVDKVGIKNTYYMLSYKGVLSVIHDTDYNLIRHYKDMEPRVIGDILSTTNITTPEEFHERYSGAKRAIERTFRHW